MAPENAHAGNICPVLWYGCWKDEASILPVTAVVEPVSQVVVLFWRLTFCPAAKKGYAIAET